MATVAVSPKKKCEFWDKCYRKNKQHKEEYLHPGDVEEVKKDDNKKPVSSVDLLQPTTQHPSTFFLDLRFMVQEMIGLAEF